MTDTDDPMTDSTALTDLADSTYSTTAAQLQEVADRSPFNRWLQLTVTGVRDHGVELSIRRRDELIGNVYISAIHGGVLASLVDTAGTLAILAQTGQTLVTVDLRIDFHSPARDTELFVTGVVLKLGRRLATSDVRILDTRQRLVASGRVVAMLIALEGSAAREGSGARAEPQ